VLRFGFAKAKFTANAIFRQTLAAQQQAVVRAEGLKVQQHLAAVVTKEAASAVANAEATGSQVVTVVADQALAVRVETVAVARVEIVRVAKAVVTVQAAKVAEIARVDQERDNK
jgi:hypothetical protein